MASVIGMAYITTGVVIARVIIESLFFLKISIENKKISGHVITMAGHIIEVVGIIY